MKRTLLLLIISFVFLTAHSANKWDPFSEEDPLKAELKVYPNPCKINKLTIDFASQEITEIRLINITGKEVLVKKYQVPTHKVQLQLNDIPNGIYLVRVKTGNKKMVVQKVMVAKN